jgi:hypothetical protein
MRIFSRRSFCKPLITPSTITSAITPTVTPPPAMPVINDTSRDARRLRR